VDIGSAVGRGHGVTERQIAELAEYRTSDAYSELERLLLDYATVLTATPVDVPDALFARLRQELDEAALVELTAAIAWENYRARFNHAFGLEAEGYSEGRYCALPVRPAEHPELEAGRSRAQ
jgi:alkylhydroperoxidase family enzyme